MRPLRKRLALAVITLAAGASQAAAAGAPAGSGAWVRLHHEEVLELHVPLGDVAADRRARDATAALQAAVEATPGAEPIAEAAPDGVVLRLGSAAVVRLGPEDAAAEGVTLEALGGQAVARLHVALEAERRRRAAHDAVYRWSMVIFTGLVALLLIRWIGRAAVAAAGRLESAATHVPAFGVAGVELVSGAAARGAAAIALRLGRFLVQATVVAAWGLSALARFDATRASRDRIAAALLDGTGALGGQLSRAVPLAVAGALGLGLVGLLVHGAGVFFEAVARGEAAPAWLPRDLARPLGGVVRGGLVLAALLLGAAAVGGDGLLGGLARAAVLALGLAAAPVAASALAGLVLVLGRVIRPGDQAEVGGHLGRVLEVGPLATVLVEEGGAQVRVPHLLSLFRPTRVMGRGPEVRP